MAEIKNAQVTQEVERLLSSLKVEDPAKYNIITNLLDEVYRDPTLGSERPSKEIEDKLYNMVDDHVRFDSAKLKP